MQVIVNESNKVEEEIKFPCFMVSRNDLVIFATDGDATGITGIVVKIGNNHANYIGEYSNGWARKNFQAVQLDIESLRNEKNEEEIKFPCLMKSKDGTIV